ncbi:MAG: hypothetical protein JWO72_1857, partial [Caulobacteraceae bacterium]|nr:hypothetical protein [Caulobacteraceae bacterium]
MDRSPPAPARLSTLPPAPAALLLGATVLLVLAGLLGGIQPERRVAPGGPTDLNLYARVIDFAQQPSTFYASVVAEQRRDNYPLYPFVTVR